MKSFLTYAVLVGVPGAGLLGILNAGQSLRAPHAVGGEWRVEAGALAGTTLRVEQSGEHLSLVVPGAAVRGERGEVRLPARSLRGRIRGDTVTVRGPGGFLPGSHACTADGDGVVRLVVDRAARRFTGEADDRCRTTPVVATQVPAAARGKGGH